MNIAIDGPAGAGKSTIAKMVAKEETLIYVDTGAMYRTMALHVLNQNIDCADEEAVSLACGEIEIRLEYDADGEEQVFLNGENVSREIRREEVGKMASKVAAYEKIRARLVALQRQMAASQDVIMDGRDIGTVVLPEADLKIFLTASSLVRAKRRYQELCEKGVDCDLAQIERDIIARDEQDMNREISPLKQAEDAIFLDTSDMSLEEVVREIRRLVKKTTGEAERNGAIWEK